MVFFDVPRSGHSHNILRADGPRPHLAATHLGLGQSCIVRVVYPEGFGRHRDIVFGIVFIGCLTAFLEIKMRNDYRE
jgi:hypothetical protein